MIFTHNIDPILLTLGPVEIRFYGLFFAMGVFIAYLISQKLFKREGLPSKDLDSIVLYVFFGLVIGARMGEVLFYNFDFFKQNPIEIFKLWNGGLSSHGAAIGIFLAYSLWTFVHKKSFSKYVDLIVIPIPIAAAFVRLGNFFNSEIFGKATNGDYGVVFKKLSEDFPRHPSQLYESLIAISIFFILYFIYKKFYKKLPPLFLLFSFVFLYFSTRFLVEFVKERQVLSYDFPLSMGQVLSVLPILVATFYFIYQASKNRVFKR